MHYREAQDVRKGDPLIEIDPRPYRAQLAQAEGILERDTHLLEQSRMDLQRYKDAWARDAIAKQQLDDQEKVVLQNEGTVKNDQGIVDYDRTQLAFCHISAPFAGRVGLRLVDPGNVVQANSTTPLVVVAQLQPITGDLHGRPRLSDPDPAGPAQGHLALMPLTARSLQTLATGVLTAVDNQIDTTTGTVRLRAQFENKNNELFPNQFVNTRLLVRRSTTRCRFRRPRFSTTARKFRLRDRGGTRSHPSPWGHRQAAADDGATGRGGRRLDSHGAALRRTASFERMLRPRRRHGRGVVSLVRGHSSSGRSPPRC